MLCLNCRKDVDPSNGMCPNCNFPLPGLDMQNNSQLNHNDNISFGNMDKDLKNNNTGNDVLPNIADNNNNNDVFNMNYNNKNDILPDSNDIEEFNRNFTWNNSTDDTNSSEEEKKTQKTKKKSNKLPIILIMMILLIMALSGYIVYGELFVKDKNVILKQSTTKQYKLTKQEALGVGNYLWSYALDTVWCKNFEYNDEPFLIKEGVNGFEITNYDKVAKYFTSDFVYEYKDASLTFNDIFGNNVLDNKYYDVNKCQREANTTYHDTVLDIKLIDKDDIIYNAISTYCEGDNCIDKKVEKEFEIVKEKNQWKIKKFYLPN